jgi:hypothetical protein
MTVALSLSNQVNQAQLSILNGGFTDQQIASEVNQVALIINQIPNVNMRPLNSSVVHGLAVLVIPFDNFLNASSHVKESDPSSACTFLAATFTLAADVTVLVAGDGSAQAVIAILGVAAQYCDAGCVATVAANASVFLSENGTAAAKNAWNYLYPIWVAANCTFLGKCVTTTPEFPVQYLDLLIFVSLAATAFLAARRGGTG